MCVFVLAAECLKKLGRGTHPIFLIKTEKLHFVCEQIKNRIRIRIYL